MNKDAKIEIFCETCLLRWEFVGSHFAQFALLCNEGLNRTIATIGSGSTCEDCRNRASHANHSLELPKVIRCGNASPRAANLSRRQAMLLSRRGGCWLFADRAEAGVSACGASNAAINPSG